jgi:uncharacterized protein with ParB-like and HNH nuclease domain
MAVKVSGETVTTNKDDVEVDDKLTSNESDEEVGFKYAITSYGADYTVDSLVGRMQRGDIVVPEFQRNYVWSLVDASRFVESLLLGLPVPGVFLSKDEEQRLLVIDGQQRLRSLEYFYDGFFGEKDDGDENSKSQNDSRRKGRREFALSLDEKSHFNGQTYRSLNAEDKRHLDNSIIHATVVKQDEPSDDQSSIYLIFERLNRGGRLLQPQEIRACIYRGTFNALLQELNQDESWRKVFGKKHSRMKDQELILRFLALHYQNEKYERPMKEFLNTYMSVNRNLALHSKDVIRKIFTQTIGFAQNVFGDRVFKLEKALNAAVFDAVMVGLAKRLDCGPINDMSAAQRAYQSLISNDEFVSKCRRATANEENVRERIRLANAAFADIK